MSYSVEPSSNGCYPGTSVLINKLDIRNPEQLEASEALIVGVKSLQFGLSPFPEPLDFDYYKRLHGFLFDALYVWAGEVRTVNLSKQHTHFCPAEEIEPLAGRMFERLKRQNYFCGSSRKKFIQNMTEFYSGINYLHPFREGNGRTQRLFFQQLAKRAGYTLDFSAVYSDRMMIATIHAASGIEDTLHQVFEEILTP